MSSPGPADEASLRKQILQIINDESLTQNERAVRIQELMTRNTKLPLATSVEPVKENEKESRISYHDEEQKIYGCKHYQQKCQIQAACCLKWYPCRLCHDDSALHKINRYETKTMVCMLCQTEQPTAKTCSNCHEQMANYYCDICHLWEDNPNKSIYHCPDCKICRVGQGLGIDFFHCKKCDTCMSISIKDDHRCIENNLRSNCPICGEYMFTSTTRVIFMRCGHCIHEDCYKHYTRSSYKCPICNKSLQAMDEAWERIDEWMQQNVMPEEYRNDTADITCNDCEQRSRAPYHFVYHKCSNCGSYNTLILKVHRAASSTTPTQGSAHQSPPPSTEND